jgi:hypothetical protein
MLYDRIIKQGTIGEPGGKPKPEFALPSTVNWMRALRILIEDAGIDFPTASTFYADQGKRQMDNLVENTVLEQLLLALHNLSALEQFRSGAKTADYARIGTVAWYYGIANAASAMTAAQAGSFQEDHAGTAKIWDTEIASRGLAMSPFSWRISSLIEKTYKSEIAAYKAGSAGTLLSKPSSPADALGAAGQYLSGSASWYVWRTNEDLKKSREFRALGVDNFRGKKAQALRDERLIGKSVGFLHQASRYRGKANYREALFLAYGTGTETILAEFDDDLAIVLRGFVAMAGAFAKRKLGKTLWSDFVADVDAQRAFTLSATEVWR